MVRRVAPRSVVARWLVPFILACLSANSQPAIAQTLSVTYQCGNNPAITTLLSLTDVAAWSGWIARLSGESPVILDERRLDILTRYSPAMFSGQPNARAFDYTLEIVRSWYPEEQVEIDPFEYDGQTWKNLIVTIPGAVAPDEVVILSAHLDSTSEDPTRRAPGAEDNASGASAVLEAARLMRHFTFERTIRLILFTGEEQGLIGSRAYVQDHDLSGVVGVINLDMFGYDRDNDRCFELHVGTRAESAPVGSCFLQAVQTYQPGLTVDYLNGVDMEFSDHASFWRQGVGAVEVLQNLMYNGTENGCKGVRDTNPHYHTTRDTIDQLNLQVGSQIASAALAAGAGMAGIESACFDVLPELSPATERQQVTLEWQALPDASAYQIYRSTQGCTAGWKRVANVNALSWADRAANAGRTYHYRIEAIAPDGVCVSLPSPCVKVRAPVSQKSTPAQFE